MQDSEKLHKPRKPAVANLIKNSRNAEPEISHGPEDAPQPVPFLKQQYNSAGNILELISSAEKALYELIHRLEGTYTDREEYPAEPEPNYPSLHDVSGRLETIWNVSVAISDKIRHLSSIL